MYLPWGFLGGGLFLGSFFSGDSKDMAVELFRRYEESDYDRATFAGGCFWGLEKTFEELDGVAEAVSGYTGGDTEDPSYKDVCSGETGHYEAVRVYYDSEAIEYRELIDVFWSYISPSYPGPGDVGSRTQYTTAVFYHNESQRKIAVETKRRIEGSGEVDVGTEVREVERFYPAEKYHQDYYTRGGSGDVSCYVPGKGEKDE
ncbi:peptide-methionine (S)-S-oxide reductase MsrA [Methanonatronarchaeum sp. AMET6-2]|uniref:peptide-methionine (S)-S-oxide reductase MsrA n=1 Tax=Methanonatronarchaeum sp. AMET6-2 TaxID=2933293 RepID=UPI0011FE3DE0|nr:peptide-methionine (S)-S-oxide reductase MsrA [Methanonatronarchaeum sp. AMET6-2]RZN62704.1 MAG: peptide-methionine (S)-S-oxide reductase [Methanonatronarchaeia archaeon]UOY09948.1 peptide-methionine (S)-S-oxide reductase MsrA [Methanonatronarchaeum sp. AMET6-2]